MIMIKGYKLVNYPEFNGILLEKKASAGKSDAEIATEVGVRSTMTIVNAFRGAQMVSDEVLTKVITAVGAKGLIVWEDGERKYFISDK